MPGKVKKAGTWRTMAQPYGKVGGTWRGAAKGWAKQNGVWVPWYSSAPPVIQLPAAPRMFRVSGRNSTTITFRWLENDPGDNVLDYQFVAVPNGGGIFLGSDPYLSNTPTYVTNGSGVFESQTISGAAVGGYYSANYDMNRNGPFKSFRVRARNANGYGPWSDMIHFPSDQGWTATFQSLPLCPDLAVSNVMLDAFNNFSFSVTGTASISVGQGTAKIDTGFMVPAVDRWMYAPRASVSNSEPSIPAQIDYSANQFYIDIYAGNMLYPMVRVTNNNATDFDYAIHFTTQAINEVPLLPSSNWFTETYTLTVGTDTASGGSFPDRGYLTSGAHTNAQQVGDIQPRYLLSSSGTWATLTRDGAWAASMEANTPQGALQKIVSIGYGWGSGEAARQRPAGIYTPYYEAPWGRETIAWPSAASGVEALPWQFVSGQTYTLTLLRSP